MTDCRSFDVSVIGGGLAGLATAIQLRKAGYTVVLIEKEQYPFHKVCGEYISMESYGFLECLGLPLNSMELPVIRKLVVSSPDGNYLQQQLPLGGFGISRFLLDNALKEIAIKAGVVVYEHCKVSDISFNNEGFLLDTTVGGFDSKVCCGSFGKKSNLDIRLKRKLGGSRKNKLGNFIAVKYHIKTNLPVDTIALHNFADGYCGVSKIESGKYCLCYLTNAANLNSNSNSISMMERNVLYRNKFLRHIFENCEMLYQSPLTISQVSFSKKTQVENHVLLTGDAAGMITPLCGNGMSMALHSSKIAAGVINRFLQQQISRQQMEREYTKRWQRAFGRRLFTGRLIQKMFGREWLTNSFVAFMKNFPGLTSMLIKQTHGRPF